MKVNDPYAKLADTLEKQIKGKNADKVPSREIVEYFMYLCAQDEGFMKLLLQKDKSLSKCFDYVFDYACAKLGRKNGAIEGLELLHTAAEYYRLSVEELEKKKQQWPNDTPNRKVKVQKADTKPQHSVPAPPPKAPEEPAQISFI